VRGVSRRATWTESMPLPAELSQATSLDFNGAGGLGLLLARPEGLEPPAYRFEACRSIQLSYGRADHRV
jgi:hypothetical protein